jgi:hypothetical protein
MITKRKTASMAWALALLAGAACSASRAEEARFCWQESHAKTTPQGDIVWNPRPFQFEKGASVRYIDFDAGSDDNAGDSKDKPWKHHPWDPEATGAAKACGGVHTYVFKRGVIYRGAMVAKESGKPGEPIRLTSDPSWGTGVAVICGSEKATGWKKENIHKDIPEPEKVWATDLNFAPRCVWMVAPASVPAGRDAGATRIPLARTPNWKVSDPENVNSEWWEWDQKGQKPFDNYVDLNGTKKHLAVDSVHLTQPEDYYQGAILWTEHGWVSGAPYPVPVEIVDTNKHALGFGGRWSGNAGSYHITKCCRYYLEDKPHYLDDPNGEFWFEKKGEGGRLYLRLPGDADPNTVQIEAAKRLTLVDGENVSHLAVSGLTFRFTNIHWNIAGTGGEGKDILPACVRMLRSGTDIRVANCLFEHINAAAYIKAGALGESFDQIVITDNEVRDTDRGGFFVIEGAGWGDVLPTFGLLFDAKVLRNKLEYIGRRPLRFTFGDAIHLMNPQTAEVAGNVMEHCYSQGIDVSGAKRGAMTRDVPLARILIHHNRANYTLESNDDYGGIETWQGGPIYVYNNISTNTGGRRNASFMGADGGGTFGHCYYLDGSFKNYHFNNIAWGRSKDPKSPLNTCSAFQEIHSYQNTFFNNTAGNVKELSRRQAPQAGRNKYLGNVIQDVSVWVFRHADPAKTAEEGNARDAGPKKDVYHVETNAYANNICSTIEKFGVFEPSGRWLEDMPSFAKAQEAAKAIVASTGETAKAALLRDPAKFDFRLQPNSPALNKGVKVFVPWTLYAMAGEWNFYHTGGDPASIIDEHWYMTPYYQNRGDYYQKPMFPLTAVNIKEENYVQGVLEDWVAGALKLNGKDQYATIPAATLAEPFNYTMTYVKEKKDPEKKTAAGPDLKNPQIHASNFVLEVYFQTEAGHTGGVLIEKMNGNGYSLTVNDKGGVTFAVKGDGGAGSISSAAKVNDGKWHHVVAESDRETKKLVVYVDGKKDSEGAGIGKEVALANDGDLCAGGTAKGRCLAGTFEFLRIALGTLADAKTTIEELYAWQFDGPFLRDFDGKVPADGKRDAGALEFVP